MALARASGVVLALIVCAWFALGIRQARDTDQAAAILSGASALTAPTAAHAASLLRAAGTLNPDREVDLLRARLALLERDRPRARLILEQVVRSEPMNIQAWELLASAAFGTRRLLDTALENIARLDPRTVRPR